jgi:hypothetical protein
VFGSTTPYIYAFEYTRRQKHRISTAASSSSPNFLNEDEEVETLLYRASQCCTFVRDVKEDNVEYYHYSPLVLHIPLFIEKLGNRIGRDASQSILLPLVTSFLSLSSWHPSLLLPLLTNIVKTHSNNNNSKSSSSSSSPSNSPSLSPMLSPTSSSGSSSSSPGKLVKQLSLGDNVIGTSCGGNIWQSLIECGGWSGFVHLVLPLAISWINPLNVSEQIIKKAVTHHHGTTTNPSSSSSGPSHRSTANSQEEKEKEYLESILKDFDCMDDTTLGANDKGGTGNDDDDDDDDYFENDGDEMITPTTSRKELEALCYQV